VRRFCKLAKPGGHALDYASGQGRNTGALLARGLEVLALDQDETSLQSLQAGYPAANTVTIDLENQPWLPDRFVRSQGFDVIITCNYLHRPRMGLLLELLAPGGLWIHETFMQGNEHYGRPKNPDFLLAPGELLTWARQANLQVLGFEQGALALSGQQAVGALVQRIAAQRPMPGAVAAGHWPLVPS
jgi:hypothetical protein